jgi:hypothetical protein
MRYPPSNPLFFLAALWLLSCTGGSPGNADGTSEVVDGIDAPCSTPAGTEIDIEGMWALKVFVRLEMRQDEGATIHVCDDPPVSVATVTWLLDVEARANSSVPFSFRTCEITLPSVSASFVDCSYDELLVAYLYTSEALDDSLPAEAFDGELILQQEGGCLEAVTDDLFVRIGIPADFDDGNPLPGWDPECSGTTALQCVPGYEEHVMDTDADGDPAATFWIETDPSGMVEGTAWATLRHTPGLCADSFGEAVVSGGLSPMLEYDFVGSDVVMAGLAIDTPTVKRNFPDFIPLAEGSVFTMVRVDGKNDAVDLRGPGGTIDCAAVLERPGLFD